MDAQCREMNPQRRCPPSIDPNILSIDTLPEVQASHADKAPRPMHIVTILAYACLFWHAANNSAVGDEPAASVDRGALVFAILLPALLFIAARAVSLRTTRLLRNEASRHEAQIFFHRALLGLRAALIGGFAAVVFTTPLPDAMSLGAVTPWLRIIGDLLLMGVFLAAMFAVWVGVYPVEVAIRAGPPGATIQRDPQKPWSMRSYLDFNVRHHFLVVAVPLTLVLFASNLTQGYSRALRSWTGWVWTPDVLLAVFAAGVFLVAPCMLRRIWRTSPLPAGELRTRLEAMCARIGLRVRDILVWDTDRLMINAAVMGVLPRVRYVLLSDALLSTMTPRQIEAVFGHEAGHVHHRHIPHFLVLAVVGWIAAATVMEIAAQSGLGAGTSQAAWIGIVQGMGIATTLLFWGIGFGWLSQRFERQADMFAAQCAAPGAGECLVPCSVHPDKAQSWAEAADCGKESGRGTAATNCGNEAAPVWPAGAECDSLAASQRGAALVCSSGAAIFASALDRVALLSGIPRDEFSWRHSSIGSRIRFLSSLAADPRRAIRFDRLLRQVKHGMLAAALIGAAAWGYYWLTAVSPALVEIHTMMR